MSINVVTRIDDHVKVNHVLISVSDKTGLESLVPGLLELNPDIRIFSTGGTYGRISEILKNKTEGRLQQVSEYTGQPETQGGLVKTLDFKVYLGLLTETYNSSHQEDMKRTQAVNIDMVVVNLYPFEKTVKQWGITLEAARGNIDIGGPTMIRAAAKNFLRVASVVDPSDYDKILTEIRENAGCTTLGLRFRLAQTAFEHTAAYDRAIADFLSLRNTAEAYDCYEIVK
jgi:phosphoribosylaminoimidazolecarboxamide formyltransferase / IMP cyclohydrolase